MRRTQEDSRMLVGAHTIIFSKDPDADRAFLRDVVGLPSLDVGGGWLIFGLPPSEVAVHPSDRNDVHEFYLMCDDVEALIAEMRKHDVACTPVQDRGWGLLTQLSLPGGGKLAVYQARHGRPAAMSAGGSRAKRKPRAKRTAAKKAGAAKKASARAAKAQSKSRGKRSRSRA
jgi:hypothetical protein